MLPKESRLDISNLKTIDECHSCFDFKQFCKFVLKVYCRFGIALQITLYNSSTQITRT